MKVYLKAGWNGVRRQPFLLLLLFVYQWAWGFYLYKFVQSAVVPLLHRFPGHDLSKTALQLFYAESEFQLTKTNLSHSYLWILGSILLVRVLLTPLLNAGVYFSIHHEPSQQIRGFLRGVKRKGKAFLMLYWTQQLLTFAPLYWLLPRLEKLLHTTVSYHSLLAETAPYAAGYLAYAVLLRVCFMYLQLGHVTGHKTLLTILMLLRNCWPIIVLSVLIFLIVTVVSAVMLSSALLWAGFIAVILNQVYYLTKSLCKLWTVSTHYELWKNRSNIA